MLLLTNSLIADSGIDFENPRPLQWLVGVLTSFITTFFCMADKERLESLIQYILPQIKLSNFDFCFHVKKSRIVTVSLPSLCDWSQKLALISLLNRRKAITNLDLVTSVSPSIFCFLFFCFFALSFIGLT